MATKSEKLVEESVEHLEEGELVKAILNLVNYADTHVGNKKTAEVLQREIRSQLGQLQVAVNERQIRLICESCNAYFWIERDWEDPVCCPYCGRSKDVESD